LFRIQLISQVVWVCLHAARTRLGFGSPGPGVGAVGWTAAILQEPGRVPAAV